VSWWFGPFYDGDVSELPTSIAIDPSDLVTLELSATRTAGTLPWGRILQEVLGSRVRESRAASDGTPPRVPRRSRLVKIVGSGSDGTGVMSMTSRSTSPAIAGLCAALVASACAPDAEPPPETEATQATLERGPRVQPGAAMSLYTPEQHDLYSGRFVLSAGGIHQVGRLSDEPGWDHMGNDGTNVQPIPGSIELDVNEIENTGTFVARLQVPEGELVIEMERFHEFSPCQDGGLAAYIFEHGDSGCGDTNWPKTFLYVAGWGYGSATLNGGPRYEDYEIHFMVTQGIRDRETLEVHYPLLDKSTPAGAVDPAAIQLDFFIRSPETDERNNPTRAVFDHFFAMEVTFR
jgi:hypothetical protein